MEKEPTTKHTLHLFKGDFEKLKAKSGSGISASRLVRLIVRDYVQKHCKPVPKDLKI